MILNVSISETAAKVAMNLFCGIRGRACKDAKAAGPAQPAGHAVWAVPAMSVSDYAFQLRQPHRKQLGLRRNAAPAVRLLAKNLDGLRRPRNGHLSAARRLPPVTWNTKGFSRISVCAG